MAVKERIPEEVAATGEMIAAALLEGGRAQITVRSLKTGEHIKLSFACKKKGADGRYISRASQAGRVGYLDADKIDVTDPDLDWPETKVGAHVRGTQRFYADTRDAARAWTARALLEYAFENGNLGEKAEIMLATRCCYCGRKLQDPISIARGVGPECFGKATGSKLARRTADGIQDGDADPGDLELADAADREAQAEAEARMEYQTEADGPLDYGDEGAAEAAAETRPLTLLEQLAAGADLRGLRS